MFEATSGCWAVPYRYRRRLARLGSPPGLFSSRHLRTWLRFIYRRSIGRVSVGLCPHMFGTMAGNRLWGSAAGLC